MAVSSERFWPKWAIWLLGVVGLIDFVWLAATPLSLATDRLAGALNGFVFAGAALLLIHMVRLPLRLQMLLSGLGFMLIAWPILRVFNHLVMTTGFPLADARLSAWDKALGFDWIGYMLWVDRQPYLLKAMGWAYTGLTIYSAITFLLILALIGVKRAREFVLIFLLTAVSASTIGLFFPAKAAMAHLAPPSELFRYLNNSVGTYHLEVLEQLRTIPAHVLALDALPGLTTFPSFHTAMGLIGIYCARGSAPLFAPLLAVNAVMIAGTPVFGSHYLVDLLAGGVLTAAAVLAFNLIERERKEKQTRKRADA